MLFMPFPFLLSSTRTGFPLSFRVINPNAKVNTTSIEETPKDMENATTNEMVDINELKPAEEKVTIFDEDGKYRGNSKYTININKQ